MMTEMMTITIRTGSESHVIAYEVGLEHMAIDAVIELANSGRLGWYDAATVLHEINEMLSQGMK